MGNVQCLNTTPMPTEVGRDALLRGQKLFQNQNYADAIESFDLAIRAGMADANIYEMHATALQAQEWHLDAIDYFTKAIHLNNIDCNLYFMRAASKEAIGDRIGYTDDMKSAIGLANSNNRTTNIYNQGAKAQGFASVAQLYESHFLLKGDAYWNLRARVRPVQHLRFGEQRALKEAQEKKRFKSQRLTSDALKEGDTQTAELDVTRVPAEGQAWEVPDLGLTLMPVGAGSFRMGSNNGDNEDRPVGTVRITRPFWMGKYEVTQKEYAQLTESNPSQFKGVDLPVETVSWEDAMQFCGELTRRERSAGRLPPNYVYRLPTEAEWEYAARGGPKSRGYTYAGGNEIDAVAWYRRNDGGTTHAVGTKAANELGIYDMSGNVWEWCHDWCGKRPSDSQWASLLRAVLHRIGHDWYGNNPSGSQKDPSGPRTGSDRLSCGGGWGCFDLNCRAARSYCNRYSGPPSSHADCNLGFRVCLAPPVQ